MTRRGEMPLKPQEHEQLLEPHRGFSITTKEWVFTELEQPLHTPRCSFLFLYTSALQRIMTFYVHGASNLNFEIESFTKLTCIATTFQLDLALENGYV